MLLKKSWVVILGAILILSMTILGFIVTSCDKKKVSKKNDVYLSASPLRSAQAHPTVILTKKDVQIVKSSATGGSVYMNGFGYFQDRDPLTYEDGIQDFTIANFNYHNQVSWENTVSHDLFTLIRIDNPTYDNNGVIIAGDLIWGKRQFSMPTGGK